MNGKNYQAKYKKKTNEKLYVSRYVTVIGVRWTLNHLRMPVGHGLVKKVFD